jgi:hypothetical protein
MTDAPFDNKTEYYCEIDSKVRTDTSLESNNNVEINVPWDDDNFSLCLDSFPASRFANTKYNKYPTIASPLRTHWGSSCEEINDDDEGIIAQDIASPGVEEEKYEIWIHDSSANSSTATITKPKVSSTKKTKQKAKRKSTNAKKSLNVVIGASFPYNNNANFMNGHTEQEQEEKKRSPSSIISSQQKSTVEHISPLTSSSIIFNQDDIFNRPLSPQSPRSFASALSRKLSNASSVQSGISNVISLASRNGSQISTSATGENWKLTAQRLPATRNSSNATSPRLSPLCQQQQRRYSPLSHQQNYYQGGSNRSGSITPWCSIAPTFNSNMSSVSNHGPNCSLHGLNSCSSSASGYYYTPVASLVENASTATRSYRSITVAKNADKLVFYSNEPSLYPPSEISEKSASFSDYFKPGYQHKKKRSGRKKSAGLFTKLMKNLKHHFINSQ